MLRGGATHAHAAAGNVRRSPSEVTGCRRQSSTPPPRAKESPAPPCHRAGGPNSAPGAAEHAEAAAIPAATPFPQGSPARIAVAAAATARTAHNANAVGASAMCAPEDGPAARGAAGSPSRAAVSAGTESDPARSACMLHAPEGRAPAGGYTAPSAAGSHSEAVRRASAPTDPAHDAIAPSDTEGCAPSGDATAPRTAGSYTAPSAMDPAHGAGASNDTEGCVPYDDATAPSAASGHTAAAIDPAHSAGASINAEGDVPCDDVTAPSAACSYTVAAPTASGPARSAGVSRDTVGCILEGNASTPSAASNFTAAAITAIECDHEGANARPPPRTQLTASEYAEIAPPLARGPAGDAIRAAVAARRKRATPRSSARWPPALSALCQCAAGLLVLAGCTCGAGICAKCGADGCQCPAASHRLAAAAAGEEGVRRMLRDPGLPDGLIVGEYSGVLQRAYRELGVRMLSFDRGPSDDPEA